MAVELTKRIEDLEDKFDRVVNLLVRVMHSAMTTLHLLHTTDDGAMHVKNAETNRNLYGFLVDD
jgi:phosphate uptake regulator